MQSWRPLLRYELASEGQNRSPIGGQALWSAGKLSNEND
jgi:hypothetical protein